MIAKRYRLILFAAALLLVGVMMTGCSGSSAQVLTGSSWPSAVAVDDVMYISYGSQIVALEPGDRGADVLWQFPLEPQKNLSIYAKPAVEGELLIVGDYYGSIWALNTITGREEWSLDTGDSKFIGGPSIMGGMTYLGDAGGILHAVDIATGSEVWTFSAEKGVWGTPLATEDAIYFTSLDAHLYAVSPESGELLWKFPEEGQEVTPEVSAMIGEPVIYDDVIYISSFNNHLYALDLATRDVLWTYETGNWMWGYPVKDMVTGNIIGTDLDGDIFALNPETGEELWNQPGSGRIVASPVLSELDGEPVVIVTSDIENADQNLFILNTSDGSPATASISVMSEFTTKFLFVSTGVDSRPVPLLSEPVMIGDFIALTGNQGDLPLFFLDATSLRVEYRCNPSTGICAS